MNRHSRESGNPDSRKVPAERDNPVVLLPARDCSFGWIPAFVGMTDFHRLMLGERLMISYRAVSHDLPA